MTIRVTAAAALMAATLMPSYAHAQDNEAEIAALFDLMAMPALLDVMQTEGLEYGEQIAGDLFQGRPADDWADTVAEIYSKDGMIETVRIGLVDTLQDADVAAITKFFASDLGQTIVTLEVDARVALMNQDIEDASKEAAAIALIDETPRAALVTTFVETNDLVETNVVGAMNANYAFYIGLMDGGGLGQGFSQDQILADVWSQEAEIRQNTTEWVYSYLLMAYQPLSDEDLQAYITFSESDAGQDINDALFAAFDVMFEKISGDLGYAASTYMVGQDL